MEKRDERTFGPRFVRDHFYLLENLSLRSFYIQEYELNCRGKFFFFFYLIKMEWKRNYMEIFSIWSNVLHTLNIRPIGVSNFSRSIDPVIACNLGRC